MNERTPFRILTINSGSSSIKFSLYRIGVDESREFSGNVSGIGLASGRFEIRSQEGKVIMDRSLVLPGHGDAVQEIIRWLRAQQDAVNFTAIGHRIVHGGNRYREPRLVDPQLLTALEELVPFAPDHLPHEILAINAFRKSFPHAVQVASFDTAFHRTMPKVAQTYALPGNVREEGVIRYGFHGLSYEYILSRLTKEPAPKSADTRVIIAHLGNGASMVAAKNGKSADTTMGFTPAGGLVMSTRSGDLDPGVILYLLKEKRMTASTVNRLINNQAGLLGVSGISSDMRELLEAETKNKHAAEAVELFCYQAKRFLGALAAVLGGLDSLVFTGGIGEHAAPIRTRICKNMDFLGIDIDENLNEAHAHVISSSKSRVIVRVMKTNEELMIARHTLEVIRNTEQKP